MRTEWNEKIREYTAIRTQHINTCYTCGAISTPDKLNRYGCICGTTYYWGYYGKIIKGVGGGNPLLYGDGSPPEDLSIPWQER